MKKLAIVGTAESWRDAPYDDPSWKIYSLNDAYRLNITRADYWCDLHNPDEWVLVPEGTKVVKGWELPPGKLYPRPHDHPKFFERLLIPAYVYQARPEWPTSITFPREAIERRFGRYMASSPAWMLAQAMLPIDEGGFGYESGDEIGIWGIHLATDREYQEQRPNFEWLIGIAEARGITITFPEDCPLHTTRWVYGFEQRPDFGVQRIGREVNLAAKEQERIAMWLLGPQTEPVTYQMPVPLWVEDTPKARLAYMAAVVMEARGRLRAAQLKEQGAAA